MKKSHVAMDRGEDQNGSSSSSFVSFFMKQGMLVGQLDLYPYQ